jgi:hypothetical protein
MKSITVIFEQNAVNTKELYHSVAATTGRQWSGTFSGKIGVRNLFCLIFGWRQVD